MKANDEVEKASVQAMITPIEEMLKALKEKQDEIETKIRSSLMMTGLVTAEYVLNDDESTVLVKWSKPTAKDLTLETTVTFPTKSA